MADKSKTWGAAFHKGDEVLVTISGTDRAAVKAAIAAVQKEVCRRPGAGELTFSVVGDGLPL